jgi:FkbM family methyltransferase
MKSYKEQDLRRLSWYGLKPLAASVVLFPPVNAVVRWLARHLMSRHQALRIPISKTEAVYRLGYGARVVLLDPSVDEIARNIYWGGGRLISPADQAVLDSVEILCRDARTFLDVGSYSGLFALLAARSSSKVNAVAFEIVPENYLLIVRNILRNDLVGRVEARLCGLAEAAGSITIPQALKLDRLASSMSIGSSFESGVRIPLTTLDEATAGKDGPFVMKIDVEGFEARVLRGGRAFFETHRPDVICEVLPGSKDFDEVEGMLSGLGYRFFLFTDDEIRPCDHIRPTQDGRDWLFSTDPENLLSAMSGLE